MMASFGLGGLEVASYTSALPSIDRHLERNEWFDGRSATSDMPMKSKSKHSKVFRQTEASSKTAGMLSILDIRFTSQMLCLLLVIICHRKTFAISLNASYAERSYISS